MVDSQLSGQICMGYNGGECADESVILRPPYRIGNIIDKAHYGLRKVGEGRIFVWQGLSLNPLERRLEVDSKDIELTDKEVELMIALIAAAGKPIVRHELLEKVWGYGEGIETHTLETHIYRLRQKLEIDPSEPKILVTVGEGYALQSS
ncbi:MAG: winged helix-turn-helix domain-containing protein [Micavibrio sp.]|nr:winged helix-turn-helix domain-containing protein [Micavibrio sp.]